MAATPLGPTRSLLELPARSERPRVRWRRARRALLELLDDPDDTAKAMELTLAVGGPAAERNAQRFAASFEGRRLLRSRASLAAVLADRAGLEALPEQSFGRAYLRYLDRNGYHPTALIDLQHGVQRRLEAEEAVAPLDPTRVWIGDRMLLAHDLLHVLTDYGTDGVGEATLLAFCLAQFGGRASAFLTLGAAIEVSRRGNALRWLRYDLRAWRRGHRAAWLGALPWEELLPLPLAAVRTLVRLEPAEVAHPCGIWRDTKATA